MASSVGANSPIADARGFALDTFGATGFGDELYVEKGQTYSVSLSDFGVATIGLERKIDGVNWHTVKQYTANAEEDFIATVNMFVRLNVTAYTSGAIVCRLQK